MSTNTDVAALLRPNTKQKVGLVLCGLYSIANIPGAFMPPPEGETGPPLGILIIGSILGVIGLVATVMAWRGNSVALRVAAGAIIVMTLTGLPAFFVDVPMWVKALVGVSVLLTVTAVVLMFSGDRRRAPVTD
jgi:hypothetical protein